MYYSHDRKLHRAGWITGVAGAAIIFISVMLLGDHPGRISLYMLPVSFMFSLPYLLLVGVGYFWPKTGGILMIFVSGCLALAELVMLVLAGMPPLALAIIAIVSGPMMASGILFLRSRQKAEERYG